MSILSSADNSLSKEELLLRLEEAEETLRAIRSGEVDALVVSGEHGDQVFTLKDSTLPYQVLIEEMNEGALTLSPNGLILYCNARFAEMLGVPMETILGKSFIHLVVPGEQAHAMALFEQRLDGKSKGELILRSSQAEIPVEISMKEIRLDGKLRLGVVVSDLTERKQIEAELRHYQQQLEERVNQRTLDLKIANEALSASRLAALNLMDDALSAQKEVKQINDKLAESEQRLMRAQEIAHLGSWELDLLTNQLTWSDEVYRIFGLEPQEFDATYEAFLEAVHPDDRVAVDESYSNSIREGKDSYEIEYRVIKRSNREVRLVHGKYEHFRNDAGEIIRSAGTVHDISERKQAEDALRRFELLSEHSQDVILFIRLQDGCILEANQAAIKAYGYSHEELLALCIQDLRADDAYALTADQMAQADSGGILFETVHRRKDGSTFPVEVSWQGAIIAGVHTLVSIVRDITERKRAEERLQQLNRTLRALSNTNQAMIHATSERQLLDDVCKIVVEDCGHSMVWIGYAKDDEKKSVKPVASAGFEAGYLETLNISWGDNDRGRGPTGTAVRTGKPSRCNNMLTDPLFAPWREQAIKRGYRLFSCPSANY